MPLLIKRTVNLKELSGQFASVGVLIFFVTTRETEYRRMQDIVKLYCMFVTSGMGHVRFTNKLHNERAFYVLAVSLLRN